MLKAVLVLVFWSLVMSEKAGREDWLDPNDMLNFDPATKTMRNKPMVLSATFTFLGFENYHLKNMNIYV